MNELCTESENQSLLRNWNTHRVHFRTVSASAVQRAIPTAGSVQSLLYYTRRRDSTFHADLPAQDARSHRDAVFRNLITLHDLLRLFH